MINITNINDVLFFLYNGFFTRFRCFAQSVSLLNDKDVLSDALQLLTYIRSIHPL